MIWYLLALVNCVAGVACVFEKNVEGAIFFFVLFTWNTQEINHRELKEKLDKMFNL